MDPELKALLEEKAEEMRLDPRIPAHVLRRARRRRAATVALAGMLTVGLVAGAVIVTQAVLENVPSPRGSREVGVGGPATPTEPIFPTTQEEIEFTQAQVTEGHMPLWTDPGGVGHLYAVNVLRWDPEDVETRVAGDEPVTVVIANPTLAQRAGTEADVRTLLTMDQVGTGSAAIYVVTAAETDILTLDSPQPGDVVEPGGDLVFAGSLANDPTGVSLQLSVTGGGRDGWVPVPPPVLGALNGDFRIPVNVPSDLQSVPIATVWVNASNGSVLGQTSFRLGLRVPQDEERSGPAPQDLPPSVADTRQAILDAAQALDWEALRDLIPEEGFTFSFGGQRDPIAYWQDLESESHVPVVGDILPSVLGTDPGRFRGMYIWPAQAAEDPAEWDEEDLEVLRRIHADEEIQSFQEYGTYLGWRVGIDRDGTWVFFVAGD